jgi:signal transduction histidine kinase
VDSLRNTTRKLRWRLTLSYTAVTVGTLLVVGLILGAIFFSRILIPDLWLTPEMWMEAANRSALPMLRNILSQEPIDIELVSIWLEEIDMRVSSNRLLRVGEAEFYIDTLVRMEVLVVGADGILLGVYNPEYLPEARIGAPFDTGTIPHANGPFEAAMRGETDPEKLFAITNPDDQYVVAVPILDDDGKGDVLGVILADVRSIPTQRDASVLTLKLLGRFALFVLIGAAIVGAVFGSVTARGMSSRFERLSQVADAWSGGDFSEFIEDCKGDEISTLGQRLNRMAGQLKNLLKRREEIAVSEERNRLARDLHDSAKQQALAASFQIGTALTLFDRDAQTAKSHLQEADRLVDSVRVELTDLIHELRPQSMDGKDIADTINDYAIEWAHQSGIEVEMDIQEPTGLSLEVKQALFRVLQESLANIARHSAAGRVRILLLGDEDIQLVVKDDGQGFDVHAEHSGMGLQSMKERAESLDGTFSVQSEPGGGTRLIVTFPGKYTNGESNG